MAYQYLQSLKKDRESLQTLTGRTKLQWWTKNVSEIVTQCIAFAIAAAPGMALTALAYILPVLTAGFLYHYELYNHITKKGENVTSCFPSAATLRNTISDQAAEDMAVTRVSVLILMFW